MALRLTAFAALAVAALAQPWGGSAPAPAPDSGSAPAQGSAPAPAAPPATPAPTTTPSPLEQYKSAAKAADSAMSALEKTAGDIASTAGDQKKTDAVGLSVLRATSGDRRGISTAQDQQMDNVKQLGETAKSAASEMGDRARDVERARKAAGGNATKYEAEYKKRAAASKQMEEHAEGLSRAAEDNTEHMFDTIRDHISEAQKGAVEAQRKKADQEEKRLEQKVYAQQAKANAIQAAKDAAAKAKAEAVAAAAKAQSDAEAAKSELAAQEAAAKEAQVAAEQAKSLAAAAAKEAQAKQQAAAAAAAKSGGDSSQSGPDSSKTNLRSQALAATVQPQDASSTGVIMFGVFVGLASLAAGVRSYRHRATPEIDTFPMLG